MHSDDLRTSAIRGVVYQHRQVRRGVKQPVVHRPNGRLGAIACADLPEDGFYMSFHGWFRDIEESRRELVGIAANDALKYRELPRRQLFRCLSLVRRVQMKLIEDKRRQTLLSPRLDLQRPEARINENEPFI